MSLTTKQRNGAQKPATKTSKLPSRATPDIRKRAASIDPKLEHIPVAKIHPNPDNPKSRAKRDITDLVASIETDGLLHPVTLRPHPKKKGHYEVRAGECRWRAFKQLKRATIPAFVRDLDDTEALRVTIAENRDREDIHPLDEADLIQKYMDQGFTLQNAADQFGTTIATVARRVQLRELTPEWRKAILNNDTIAQWPAALLETVAKYPAATQNDLLEGEIHASEIPTKQSLSRQLAHETHLLEGAPWKLDDDTLLPAAGACTSCTKRSDCQPELFEDEFSDPKKKKSNIARCVDTECWNQKAAALIDQKEADIKASGKPYVFFGSRSHMDEKDPRRKHVIDDYNYQKCKASDPKAVAALHLTGPHAGTIAYVKPYNSGRGNQSSATARGDKPVPLKERRAKYDLRRNIFIIREAIEGLKQYKKEYHFSIPNTMALLLCFGMPHEYRTTRDIPKNYATWRKSTPAVLAGTLTAQVLDPIRAKLQEHANSHDPDMKFVTFIYELLDLDLDEVTERAAAEIPYPKSWANLNADGTPKKAQAKPTTSRAKAKAS